MATRKRWRSAVAASVGVALMGAAAPAWAQVCYMMPFTRISSPWGDTAPPRTSPHRGTDFPAAAGTPIPAVADGTVVVNTTSGCLGNVIVVAHADGMYSGYSHMNERSGLGVGTPVGKGQHIGRVGNTGSCSRGAHLHLTIGNHVNSYYTGASIDPVPFIQARLTCNRNPRGAMDGASCESVWGWAQDEDAPSAPLSVHIYMDSVPGQAGAQSFATTANKRREDLCGAIGSCEHGYDWRPPLAYQDGVEHTARAYAINTPSGHNPELGGSGKTFRCDLPALPYEAGAVRRHILSAEVMSAWRLTTLDISQREDGELDMIPDAPALSATPDLIKVAGGEAVYVLEYGVMRHVAELSSLGAWRLDGQPIREVSAEEAAQWLHGARWPATPFLAKGSAEAVYMIDAPPPLWAELVADDLPTAIPAGSAVSATLTFKNLGSLTWAPGQIALAPTPRDGESALCDESWPSCTRAAPLMTEVVPGATGAVTLRLLAPLEQGPIRACFGLVMGDRWFSDPGHNGPPDDALCQTIMIGPPAEVGEPPAPADPDDLEAGPNARSVEMEGGCGCAVPGGSPDWAALGLLGAALGLRHQRRRRR